MNYDQVASLIPKEYRDEILKTNMVANALAQASDNNMHYLRIIWRNYLEPEVGECPLCLDRILEGFRKMLPTMIEIAKNENLLNSI